MNVEAQIEEFIGGQPEPKRTDLQELDRLVRGLKPKAKLWFFDGKNEAGKVVSNPTIGYGAYTIQYADGTSKETFRIGLSANKTGVSVYVLGLEDKSYLLNTYGTSIGKASVTGYCIRFKRLTDIDRSVLTDAIRYGFDASA